jgi:glutathione synthase/RimK-type ligase-like ATP-grasp enzyme
MRNILVLDSPDRLKLQGVNAEIVSTRDYLSSDFPDTKGSVRVYNLSYSTRYQSLGYYVSLLAEARGHAPRPGVDTLRDLRMILVARSFTEDIDERVQSSLADVKDDSARFRIFCGKTTDKGREKLARDLYRLFPSPILEVQFIRKTRWQLASIRPMTLKQLDEAEFQFFEKALQDELIRKERKVKPGRRFLYDLAVVTDPKEENPPSDPEALELIAEAAKDAGFFVETIHTGDMGRINEFDAVFIRQTTAVNHPIYQLSRLAFAEGLVVVDDPWSILRSANKIFLAESLDRARLPSPQTWVLTRHDLSIKGIAHIHHPCVLKIPDGSFSKGVRKSSSREETLSILGEMLKQSDLILAQEFLPSDYDWRIGILGNQPLFACKYFMAQGHWQIYNWSSTDGSVTGNSETVPLYQVPPLVLDTALKAARLVGDGLYGVDLKQIGDRVMVIEVNDNPNLDAGIEDHVEGEALYRKIAMFFRERIESQRGKA